MVLKAPEFRCAARQPPGAARQPPGSPSPGSPSPATRPEQAAERLAELATAAEPGSRLGTKEDLRAVCGVSVGTFNEALRLVQARGLVTVRTGRVGGLFASRQSPLVRLGNSVLAIDDGVTSAADAARIRDALDPLVIEDAVRHRSASDLEAIRQRLQYMRAAADALDGIEFLRANWALHARIAQVSPIVMLRSLYLGLLEMIASHTRLTEPADEHPLPEYLECRYRLHADLVSAIDAQDGQRALGVIRTHNATVSTPALSPSDPGNHELLHPGSGGQAGQGTGERWPSGGGLMVMVWRNFGAGSRQWQQPSWWSRTCPGKRSPASRARPVRRPS